MTQRKTDPGKGFLRGQVILIYLRVQSHMRTVYFMNHYFCANIMQFKFNLLQTEQVDSQLTSLVSWLHCSVLLPLQAPPLALTQLTCGKSAYLSKYSTHLILPLMQTNANIKNINQPKVSQCCDCSNTCTVCDISIIVQYM